MSLPAGEVTVLDAFLSAEECTELLDDLRFAWWWDSPLIQLRPDGSLASGTSYRRTSKTTSEEWLSEDSVAILRRVARQLADLFGIRPEHLEMWQATRYRRGDWFGAHHDAGFFARESCGERTTTVLVYLDGQHDGGSLVFPRLGRRFRPAPGRVLLWPNLLPDGGVDQRMLHEARPARSVKTTLTTWARQRPVRIETPRRNNRCRA